MTDEPEQPKKNESIISSGNRAVFPQKCLDHINVGKGDQVNFYNVPGPAIIVIKKESINVSSFLKSLLAAVAVVALLSTSFMPAFAQNATQPVNEIDKFNEPEQTISSITGEFIETYTFEGPAAYTPWRIDITYPKGVQDIQNITSSSANFPFSLVVSGDKPTGFITKSFSTETITTFAIELGQVYEREMNDVGTIVIYSNNTIVAQYLLHVDGMKFHKKFLVETGQAPHFPTTDEILAGFQEPLDTLITNTATINARVDDHNAEASVTNESNQGVAAAMFVVLLGMIAVFTAQVRLYRKQESSHSTRVEVVALTPDEQRQMQQQEQSKKPWWRFW